MHKYTVNAVVRLASTGVPVVHVHIYTVIKLTSGTRQLFNAKPLPFYSFSCNSAHMILRVTQQNVLGFDVCVNDSALRMKIIQTLQCLLIEQSKPANYMLQLREKYNKEDSD